MPAYTRLQRAQPVTVGHHLLAWVEMLERDRARFRFAARAGHAAAARSRCVRRSTLDLPAPAGETMRDSLDAVADRDFALDYLYACAVLASHLSRIGEELVLWSSSEFAFARLPERAATGSSAMPQKLNPDVAELVRGKAGTALGASPGCSRSSRDFRSRTTATSRRTRRRCSTRGGTCGSASARSPCSSPSSRSTAAASPRRARTRAARDRRGRGARARRRALPRGARARRRGGALGDVRATRFGAGGAAPGPGGVAAALEDARAASPSRSHVQRRSLTCGREAAAFRGVRVGDPLSRIPDCELI